MKSYNVKAKIKFNDTLEKATRKIGDTFKCTKERYELLKEYNAVELINIDEEVNNDVIEEVVEEVVEEGTKTKAKTKSKTKKK